MQQLDLVPAPDRQAARDRISRQRSRVAHDWPAMWDREIAKHPHEEDVIADCVRRLFAESKRPIGMPKVWEALRGKTPLNLDNSFRAPAGRRLMERYPDLVGKIAIRGDAGQVRERAR